MKDAFSLLKHEVGGGDQCLLGDSVTEVNKPRVRLVLGWVIARDD